jgi:hypothetical protein
MRVGKTTPAIHGSKYTNSSCRPTKYHGAFEGLGVLFGSAMGSKGAGISIDQSHSTIVVRRKQNTIVYIKYGHVSSYRSELAVGTGRATLLPLCRVSFLSVVAITSCPFSPRSGVIATAPLT